MGILETVGRVAGIGGIALGVLLILFRDIVRKEVFATLTREQSYKLMRLLLILIWSIALAGITAWLVAPMIAQPKIQLGSESKDSQNPELGVEKISQSAQFKVIWKNLSLSSQYKLFLTTSNGNWYYYQTLISEPSGMRTISPGDGITMVVVIKTQPEIHSEYFSFNKLPLSDPRISGVMLSKPLTQQ